MNWRGCGCLKRCDLCPVVWCTLTTNSSYSVQAAAAHGLPSMVPVSAVSSRAMPGTAGTHGAAEGSHRGGTAGESRGEQGRAAGAAVSAPEGLSTLQESTVWYRPREKDIQCCRFAPKSCFYQSQIILVSPFFYFLLNSFNKNRTPLFISFCPQALLLHLPLERVTLSVLVQTQDQKVLLKLMPKNMKNNFLEEKFISLILSFGGLHRTVP